MKSGIIYLTKQERQHLIKEIGSLYTVTVLDHYTNRVRLGTQALSMVDYAPPICKNTPPRSLRPRPHDRIVLRAENVMSKTFLTRTLYGVD